MESNQIMAILLPISLLFLFIIILKTNPKTKSWLHPATFYSSVWFLLITSSVIFFLNDIQSSIGIYWILITALTFSAGTLLPFKTKKDSKSLLKDKRTDIKKQIKIVLILFILLGITSSIIVLFYQVKSLSSLLNLSSYRELTKNLSLLRYYTNYVPPLISQIFLFAVYVSPLIGGILLSIKETRKDVFLSISSVIPAVLIFLLNSTRYPVIASITLFLSSYFTFNIYLNKKINIKSKKVILSLIALILFLMLILYLTLSLRIGGKVPTEYLSYQFQTEKVTVFGYLPAFSQWFKTSYNRIDPPSFGAYTFSGLFDFLKIKERPPGLYSDYIKLGNDRTNIFTAHRGLIQDFSPIGALLFIFLIGILTGYSYTKLKNKNLRFSPILIIFYSFTMLSFIASILNYNSIILAIIVYSLIAFYLERKIQNEN